MDYLDYEKYTFCYFWSPCLEQIQIAGHFEGVDQIAGHFEGEDPDNPVVIEVAKNKDELDRLLRENNTERPVVVICGIGCMKNTTLAIAVIQRRFFITDCLRIDLRRGLLAEEFMDDELRTQISEASRGAYKPVYLAIHEILSPADFEMFQFLLLRNFFCLPMGSMILFRVRSLEEASMFQHLNDIQVHSHGVNSLSEPQAKRLLCLYAFSDQNRFPNQGINTNALLQICEGIPAALRIVGSQLRTKRNDASPCNEILEYHRQ